MKVLIAANPYSGSGNTKQTVAALAEALAGHGLTPTVTWERVAACQELSDPAFCADCRCVVVAGGDGTLADAINVLYGDRDAVKLPIATVPSGTENLFAKEFGYVTGPQELADAIARGKMRDLDLGRVNGRLFHLMASVGFDSDVVRRLDNWRRGSGDGAMHRVRKASYVRPILGAMGGYGFPRIRVIADGEAVAEGCHAFVFNTPRYGGGLGLCPAADPADGRLDYVVFARPGMMRMFAYGLSVVRGRHFGRSDVFHGRAEHLRFEVVAEGAEGGLPIQADGDPAGVLPGELVVEKSLLQVVSMD